MINKQKIKRIILLSLFSTIIFQIGIINVMAAGGGSGGSGGSESGGDDSAGHSSAADSRTPTYGSACTSVRYKTQWSWNNRMDIEVDVKKMDGTKIDEDVFDKIETEFLAGTYVMLRVYEKRTFNSSSSCSVSAKRQKWNCTYYNWEQIGTKCTNGKLPGGGCRGNKVKPIYDYVKKASGEESCSCSGTGYDKIEHSFKGWYDVSSEYADSCSGIASSNLVIKEINPSYTAVYKDSNDIDEVDTISVEGHKCSEKKQKKNNNIENGIGLSYSNECTVSYDRNSTVCMNVKTGEVTYIDDGRNCNDLEPKGDYYTIEKDDEGYWKYFIPLNANSHDDFEFILDSKIKEEDGLMCQNFIDSNPTTYQNLIVGSKGESFVGTNYSKTKAKEMVKDGCFFKTTIKIPVVQKFYNELDNGINFKGFNFYYKPIDISNPFPNGLTDTSLWYDWNEDKDKEPDIEDSYKQVTYIANTNGNENKIRNYTKDNPYTSWKNMNVDGYSYFIKNEGIVEKIDKTSNNKFYKLGCGPWNENPKNDDGSKNYFYQPECGDTK